MSDEPNEEVTEDEKKPAPPDETLKAPLADLKRRYRVLRERFDEGPDTPAAA